MRISQRTGSFCIVGAVAIGGLYWGSVKSNRHKTAFRHFMTANELQKEGRTEEAIGVMKQALAEEPHYFEARLGLSDFYLSLDKVSDAVKTLEEGLQNVPADKARYLEALGDLFYVEKDYTRAIRYTREAIQENPDNQPAYRRLPLMLEKVGKRDEAEKAWQEYIQRYPQDTASSQRGLARLKRMKAPPKSEEQPPEEPAKKGQ